MAKGTLSKRERVIVALDTPDLKQLDRLLGSLDGMITYYKVGFELFTAHGWQAVERVKSRGARVFLDLKLHDIPNTVAKTAEVLCAHEIDMFNVHTLGGLEMMRRTREAAEKGSFKPIVIGVTVLTSHDAAVLKNELGIFSTVPQQVLHLARLARMAGLHGVVCSAQETALIRTEIGEDFLTVTPGIRPAQGRGADDQKRVMTPAEAFQAGSSYIVVGRPVTEAADPAAAAEAILKSL